MHLLMTEFDGPEVTLCGCQDVKIQLITNKLLLADGASLLEKVLLF